MKSQVILSIIFLLSAFSGASKEVDIRVQTPKSELEEVGLQLTELYLRGYRWPVRKFKENCWKKEELPNVVLDMHKFENEDNPDLSAKLLQEQNRRTLRIEDYKIISRGIILQNQKIKLSFSENHQFIFQFMIELNGKNGTTNYVGCKKIDDKDLVRSCLEPIVVGSLAEAFVFEISGDALLDKPQPSPALQQRVLSSSNPKPHFAAMMGLFEPEKFNLIKSECYTDPF